MVLHTCDPSTQKAEARGSQVQGQLGLHRETLFQKCQALVTHATQEAEMRRIMVQSQPGQIVLQTLS
jgi:hypothetical protein